MLGDAGPPQMNFAGNIPYNTVGLSGRPSGTRRTIAGSSPPTWRGSGARAPSRWASSTGITSSRTRAGPWAAPPATSTSTGSRPAATTPPATTSSQTGDPFASFLLGQVHDANQSIYAQPTWYESYLSPWVNAEFKINPQAHGDRGAAPGLPDRPHRGERRVLDVRSEHAQPGRGRPPRGRDLRGQRSGSYGIADVREPEVGRLGTAGRVLLSRQRQDHGPRRVRDVLRRGGLLPVHAATRTSGSRRTRRR